MRIAITRLPGKDRDDRGRCARFGNDCYTVSPLDAEVLPAAIETFAADLEAGRFDGLFFTSALPADLVGPRLAVPGRHLRVVAIGPATRSALARHGVAAEVLPAFYSRDFVPYMGSWLAGKTVGIPRADIPNEPLLEAIRRAGGEPAEHRIYRLIPTGRPLDLEHADAVLFTSANSFSEAVWEPRPGLLACAIGEITAERMRRAGTEPDAVGDGSLEGALRAIGER
ncbi:MAG: uroporphyrinogen-III synthase [Methanospirillum sp.]|nr:uroporphyrinogen-III synthase [Methanospirillum sp.]